MGALRRRIWRPTTRLISYVYHVHYWDHCRDYGQYSYRICLNGCNERRPC